MLRKQWLFALTVSVALIATVLPVAAQDAPNAYTSYQLNMRTGPGTTFDVVGVLPAGTGLFFEGRSSDMAWLLGHTADAALRGWVSGLYLDYQDGFNAMHLPVTDEVIAYQAPAAAPPSASGESAGQGVVPLIDPAVDMSAGPFAGLPVVPAIGPRVRDIFARGQELGNNPRVFTQVGECNTMAQPFMVPFGSGEYYLGPYGHLQATIDFFASTPAGGQSNSFWLKGLAMQTGFTCAVAVDAAWTDPQLCPEGGSLLECEYDRVKPSVALINLGIYDVYWLSPAQYEQNMRRIVDISITKGVIPVLTTFPTCAGDQSDWPNDHVTREQNRLAFNTILANLAQEYGIPLMNLWRATQPLPGCGLEANDFQHISQAPNRGAWAAFDGAESQYGVTMWNLVALQTLDALRRDVLAH